MKKGGLTVEKVAAKLQELMGNYAAVGRAFGVNRVAVWRFVQKHAGLLEIANDVRESMKDNVESRFYTDCLKDNPAYQTSRIFFLKTQGRNRGYQESHEVHGPHGQPLMPSMGAIVAAVIAEERANADGSRAGTTTPDAGSGPVSR